MESYTLHGVPNLRFRRSTETKYQTVEWVIASATRAERPKRDSVFSQSRTQLHVINWNSKDESHTATESSRVAISIWRWHLRREARKKGRSPPLSSGC